MNVRLTYFSAVRFLSRYIKKYKKHFITFYIGWLIDSLLVVVMPVLLGIMIDEIVYYQNLEVFLKCALVLFSCIVFSGILYFFIYAQHGYLMNMFVFSIRKDVFIHYQKCDARFLSSAMSGEMVSVLQSYCEECMHFVIRNIIHFSNGILLLCIYTIYLLLVDWRIGLIALGAAIVSTIINMRLEGKIRGLGTEERECYGEYIGWIYEIITALSNIRMLGAQKRVEELFEKKQKAIFGAGRKSEFAKLKAENAIAFVNLVVKLVMYVLAAWLAIKGNVTLGVLIVIFEFFDKLSYQIKGISLRYFDAQTRISYIQKIYDFLQLPVEQEGNGELLIKRGEIQFDKITMGYEETPVLLKELSLIIKSGERVALVGKSGCGKSTLAHMLIGFFRPQSGVIRIDGQNLSECNLRSVRQEIGLVQQDVCVFDGTIRQNILLGNKYAKEKELIEACKAAGLWEVIEALPDGLDTMIGSQGQGLSGGQKQRLAIARIYLNNPRIIIFDEATSSLDMETEQVIHRELDKVLRNKTAIIIAHRQSSVMLCDRVVLLEDGKIVESGKPYEMIRTSVRFQKLFAIEEAGI
ncbi:MAG: ABC transporter ATP-binding protein [Lachnospiraceae bacterium]|nr:ABC transporter ATP-binding protein [Lachnospiraceae bacterium]